MAVAAVCDRRKMSGQYNGDAHRAPLQMKAKMENRGLRMAVTATPERSASPGSAGVPPAGGWDSQRNEPAGRQRSQERWRMVVAAVCDRRNTNPRTGMSALREPIAKLRSGVSAERRSLCLETGGWRRSAETPLRRKGFERSSRSAGLSAFAALRGAVQPAILHPPFPILALAVSMQ